MNSNIEKIMVQYPSLRFDKEKSKIICQWTQHEMPLNEKILLEYINGQKYQHLLAATNCKSDLNEYKEFLVPCKEPYRKNQLFCQLTYRHLNNQIDHIEKHLNGKRFQKALKHWNHCKETNTKYKPPCYQSKTKEKYENSDDENETIDNTLSDDFYPKKEESMDVDDDKCQINNGIDLKRKFNVKINSNKKSEPSRKKHHNQRMDEENGTS